MYVHEFGFGICQNFNIYVIAATSVTRCQSGSNCVQYFGEFSFKKLNGKKILIALIGDIEKGTVTKQNWILLLRDTYLFLVSPLPVHTFDILHVLAALCSLHSKNYFWYCPFKANRNPFKARICNIFYSR